MHLGRADAYNHYRVSAEAAQVGLADPTEKSDMKCSIAGCPGSYERRSVHHTVRLRGRVIVIDHVPDDVCDMCCDVLFKPQTVRRIEELLETLPPPRKTAPLYEYT